MKRFFSITMLLLAAAMGVQAQQATVRVDAQTKHQHITGFGGFVCSPQFTYNHMSTNEIKKVWGKSSTVGCNIMRLYIPIGRNAWSQSLSTAKQAKQLGLIVFASPWGQPAEWKTNGTSNAKNEDGTTGKLKRENWADYAQYLEDYVQYLRKNGVELDAISIQNEPDWPATYAGCLWDASEIAEFVRLYGRTISCKIMAPETLAVSDAYANALNSSNVVDSFDIYGGHQYGGIQTAYKKLAQKGKEIWMTEYLINWNETEGNTRNFDFSKDFFNFFRAINICMLGDFNAWIHYAAKRYYGMMGDGQRGAGSSGVITKRGYIMAHFAKYVTGYTRIDAQWNDEGNSPLEGSAYLSASTDTVAIVIANPSDDERELCLDLPFYTQLGQLYYTSKTKNMTGTELTQESETCRPVVTLPAQSVSTVLFYRSRDRQPSNMKGSITRFDRIEEQQSTKSNFGTAYKLSNKTKTFDHSNPLISTRTTSNYGYLALNNRFTQLIFQVKKVSSTMNYTSSQTTLYYINNNDEVNSHDYGEIDLNRKENFNLVFDISPNTLPDGCKGVLSITNNNYSSKLTLTLGTVYFATNGSQYAATLSGAYVADDSYVLNYTSDSGCTSIDVSNVTELPGSLPWLNSNRVVYTNAESPLQGRNIIKGDTCQQLLLTADGGTFRPAKAFMAQKATFADEFHGLRLLVLPFKTAVPTHAKVYTFDAEMHPIAQTDSVEAHQPMLVDAHSYLSFTGSGAVSYTTAPLSSPLRGVYTATPLYVGDYIVASQDGQWGFERVTSASTLLPFDAYATLSTSDAFVPLNVEATGIRTIHTATQDQPTKVFNLMGQQVSGNHRGLLIINGKKVVARPTVK